MQETSDLIGILLALIFQITLAGACFIGFSILRPLNAKVYEPRTIFGPKRPERLDSRMFSWIKPVFRFREMDSIDELDVDGIMFLRFVVFGFKFFGAITISSVLLIAIHVYAPHLETLNFLELQDEDLANPSLTLLSITNVPKGSLLFYFHAFLAYGYSMLAYYLVFQTWKEYVSIRQRYFESIDYVQQQHNRTLLLTYIPPYLQSTKQIEQYTNTFTLDYIPTQIFFGRDYMDLPRWIEEHKQATAEFESLLHNYYHDASNIPLTRPTKFKYKWIPICCNEKEDAIEYYKNKLHDLERKIYQARSRSDGTFKPDSSCFFQYSDILTAHLAANQIFLESKKRNRFFADEPRVDFSPHFDDIEWDNIGLSRIEKFKRKVYAFFAMVLITILWILFSVFIGFLSQITLWRNINEHFANTIAKSQAWIIFVQSFLTPFLMALANWVLPSILKKVAYMQGLLSGVGIGKSAMIKYFVLQFYLMLSHIGTSLVDSLIIALSNGRITNAFQTFVRQLLNQFVTVGTFYINYTVTGYTFFGLEILQGLSLSFALYDRFFKNHTPREAYKRHITPDAQYVVLYGFLLMTFLLGISYSLIAPLIVPFTALSFGIAYIAMKYQLMYVYDSKIDSGGTWWPKVFNLICFSIFVFQLMTFGSVFVVGFQNRFQSIDHGLIPNILLMILPFLTIAYWIYMNNNICPKGNYMERKDYSPITHSLKFPKEDTFAERVFNPAVSKPLRKVWVRPELSFFLESIYTPEFKNTVDFVRKSDPDRASVIEKQQLARSGRIKALMKKEVERHRQKTLADVVFLSRQQQEDPEIPPELPALDPDLFPRCESPTMDLSER